MHAVRTAQLARSEARSAQFRGLRRLYKAELRGEYIVKR